jgi:hypothetical protein
MEFSLEISGDIVERSELLNGTESVTLQGVSDDSRAGDDDRASEGDRWDLTGIVSWNLGLVDYAGEGDLTLTRGDGAELYGSLVSAAARRAEGDAAGDWAIHAEYEIDGGSGQFDAASGRASAQIVLAGDTFRGQWAFDLGGATP